MSLNLLHKHHSIIVFSDSYNFHQAKLVGIKSDNSMGYYVVPVIAFFLGAVTGYSLGISLSFLGFINQGYYHEDDTFYSILYSWIIGMPIGGVVGILLSIFFVQRGMRLTHVIIMFGIASLLNFSLATYLEARVNPFFVKAAKSNDLVQVQAAIRNYANLNEKDINGRTALMYASSEGYYDIAKVLIQAEADVNATGNDGRTALIDTSWGGHTDIAKALIQAGADVNARANNGTTALMGAAYGSHNATVKVLIQAGANINAKSNDGRTALMLASQAGSADTVRIFREAGAKE